MYDAVHQMRTRIMTNPAFTGEKVIGAILFENTMVRTVPYCVYYCLLSMTVHITHFEFKPNNLHPYPPNYIYWTSIVNYDIQTLCWKEVSINYLPLCNVFRHYCRELFIE